MKIIVLLLVAMSCMTDATYKKASDCVSEFVYYGKTYQDCTEANSLGKPWCSVDENFVVGSGRWRYCTTQEETLPSNYVEHHECVFPFIYKNIEYTTCTKVDAQDYWCSTSREYKYDGWRYCPKKANEDDVPANIKGHSNCKFPFIYTNELYTKCLKKNWHEYWCSTTKTYISGTGNWETCTEDQWTVIQRRIDASVRFDRTWEEYKNGFGDPDGNFWLGNDKLHELTSAGPMKIRFDLWDKDDKHAYAEYSSFKVASESDNYRLSISGYSGDAGDGMTDDDPGFNHNNIEFSTKDQDHDKWDSNSCSRNSGGAGGWWFNDCFASNLNGRYLTPGEESWTGLHWYEFTEDYSLKKTIIKIAYINDEQ